MKQLLAAVAVFVLGMFVSTPRVFANEGNVDMSGAGVSCKAISLWQSGQYQVTGRCEGLVYPYKTQYDCYMLWAKTQGSGDIVTVAEVTRGYFSGNVANAFSTLFITAETSNNPHRPSAYQVASGAITPFSFDTSAAAAPVAPTQTTATTQSQQTGTMTVQQGESAPNTSGSTVGAVVGRIVTSLLVIILVVVGVAIGASLIFRSRGSVSA